MDKKIAFAITALTVIIFSALGFAYYINTNEADTEMESSSASSASETTETEIVDSEESIDKAIMGEYRNYSEEAVLATTGTKLLFFHAPWCPQCRSIETSIEQDGLPEGVTVFKVDYDSNQDLRQKYGVTIQTTFVLVDDSGNKIDSYVAYQEPTFASVERELLQ